MISFVRSRKTLPRPAGRRDVGLQRGHNPQTVPKREGSIEDWKPGNPVQAEEMATEHP